MALAAEAGAQVVPGPYEDPVLWVEVRDDKGFHPDDLSSSDLEVVTADGVVRTVSVVDLPLRRRGGDGEGVQWLVYVDQTLSTRGTIRRALDVLSEITGPMAGLGELEVVSARPGEEPEVLVRTGDPLISGERFSRMALTERGHRGIQQIRERALQEWRESGRGAYPLPAAERAAIVISAIEEEIELVDRRLRRMAAWVGSRPVGVSRPRVLLPILDGFDLDPVAFWSRVLDQTGLRLVREEAPRFADLSARVDALADGLAAAGWIVMPLAIQPPEAGGFEPTLMEGMDPQRESGEVLPGVTFNPGDLFGKDDDEDEDADDGDGDGGGDDDADADASDDPVATEDDAPPSVRLVAPREGLARFAGVSGGDVILTDPALRDAVDRFADRVPITWRATHDYADDVVSVEVRPARPGWNVLARSRVARGVPRVISELRLGRVLAGREDAGDLSLAAVLEVSDPGEATEADGAGETGEAGTPAVLDARLDLADLAGQEGLESVDLQVTVQAVGLEGDAVLREVVEGQDLSRGREWRWRRDLELPADATAVAVLVEELERGLWGGRRASVVRSAAGLGGDFLPSPTVLEVQRPEEAVLRGRVRFEVDVWDPSVASVAFLLDEREVAVADEPPFAARLDLGRTPRRQELTVIGYDPEGREVGRDTAVLNGGEEALAVEIVRPADARGVGNVEVEAKISLPVERQLDRVLFFWNNQQVATLYSPPFRQRIWVPEAQKVGYVRVVALLDDGSLAEDVLFLNGPSAGERVEVELVELYVVVQDDEGRPVRGLRESDFVVEEDGEVQEIATFSDAAELPLTLGMAIDSSASMFVKLPSVQQAATRFLRSTFDRRDRAFVVDFDSQPRLARGTTNDLQRLENAIWNLEASGRTALWESIVFSLVQLQGSRGRKALVVFSDGADEDDQFPFRSAVRIAREMGVPIYLILMKKEPEESIGFNLLRRSFTSRVDRLVEATGGKVYYGKEYDDLGQVYDEIEEDLRSQYLLAYYPKEKEKSGWRDVDVEVLQRGLEARTLSGYRQ